MIGIDLTKISRFKNMTAKRLARFSRWLNLPLNSAPIVVAKTWAIHEALIKAKGTYVDPSLVEIKYPNNSRPIILDKLKYLKDEYIISISHEGDLLTAIVLRK